MAYRQIPLYGQAPRGTVIRRDVPILESRAVNERRRAERDAAGLTNDFKLKDAPPDTEALQDPRYYARLLGETNKTNLEWDEL
jgi:hypothetical protein